MLLAVLLAGAIGGCRLRHQPLELVDFTVAIDPAGAEEAPPPTPPKLDAPPPPTPPKPDDISAPKPQQRPKPVEEKKQPPKKPVEIKKGKRIKKTPDSSVKPVEPQRLTDEEILRRLNQGAKIGERTSLPPNEMSRNASLLKAALYEAWTPPPKADSGFRPAVVAFGISKDGGLLSPKIETSSGSQAYDESCLDAVRRVGRVAGLSASFIREYGKSCSFEFRQKE